MRNRHSARASTQLWTITANRNLLQKVQRWRRCSRLIPFRLHRFTLPGLSLLNILFSSFGYFPLPALHPGFKLSQQHVVLAVRKARALRNRVINRADQLRVLHCTAVLQAPLLAVLQTQVRGLALLAGELVKARLPQHGCRKMCEQSSRLPWRWGRRPGLSIVCGGASCVPYSFCRAEAARLHSESRARRRPPSGSNPAELSRGGLAHITEYVSTNRPRHPPICPAAPGSPQAAPGQY